MTDSKYTAGLHFVVTTPGRTKHDRRAILSHVRKSHGNRRRLVQMRSWINPNRDIWSPQKDIPSAAATLTVPSPARFGEDFSALELPQGVEPQMIQSLVKWIRLAKSGVYPYEICLDVHQVEKGWFPYMIHDACCLHSMMFSVRAFLDGDSNGLNSPAASFHYAQTLRLLQERLNEFTHTSSISDSTIIVVVTLAMFALSVADFSTAANHINGLFKIVSLRGGVRRLNTHNNMQFKVCRVDLEYALRCGHRPRLFGEEVVWDCFIADRGLIRCSHDIYESQVRVYAETTLDPRLLNAWRDLHAFSCISNLTYQTTRKLSPYLYNEMMTSVFYRLTHLSFNEDPLQETVRIALLAFASTAFLMRQIMDQPFSHLFDLYHRALSRLRQSTHVCLPASVELWLVTLLHMAPKGERVPMGWEKVWLSEAIHRANVSSWLEARDVLKSIMWVDFIHDPIGKKILDGLQ